jgi:patatin-like phospholipase/acyl hydrolase
LRKLIISIIAWTTTSFLSVVGSPVRILSLDGGGTRGFISALLLAEIERQTGHPITDLFDVIVGTSTGGLIAAALCSRASQNRLSAQDVVMFYRTESTTIFPTGWWHNTKRTFGLVRSKFATEPLERLLWEKLGEQRLSQSQRPLGLTAFELTAGTPLMLVSHGSSADAFSDMPIALAVRATTAAPLYFDPLHWQGKYFIDGGVFANHPGLYALKYARALYPQREYRMLSLGTGMTRTSEWHTGGLLQAGTATVQILLSSPSQVADMFLHQEMGPNYWRFQPDLGEIAIDLSDASPSAQERMGNMAHDLISTSKFKALRSGFFKNT